MTTWIWSDLHVGHKNLSEKWRAWAGGTVDLHTQHIVEAWKSCVRPHDDIWIIGDACMGKLVDSLPVIEALPGTKHLVPGNHDRVHSSYHHKSEEQVQKFQDMYGAVFTIERDTVMGMDIGLDQYTIINHFPWRGTEDHEDSDRDHLQAYAPDRDAYPPQTVLIHGHTHSAHCYGPMSVHVGVDTWPEGPIPLETVQLLVNGARKNAAY